MRVEVESHVCQGTEFCVQVAPDLFALDEDGRAVVRQDPIDDGRADEAREAVNLCPTRALTLIET